MTENLNQNHKPSRTDGQRKKIIFLITKSNWGGAQKYVYDLATNLSNDVFEVIVVLGGSGILKNKLEENNIKTINLLTLGRDISFTKDIKTFSELFKILKKEKPDIVHLNSSKIGAMGSLVGRLVGVKKIIFTAHGWAFNEDRNYLSKLLIKSFSFFSVLLSNQTIAVSEKIKQQTPLLFFLDKKVKIIHNSITPILFKGETEARNNLGNFGTKETIWLGTISELHKNKGLKYSIKAMSVLKKMGYDFVFVIIGEGEERFYLESIIKKYDLEENVFLIGHKDNAASLLKAFDIFILSSITEALGYVLLESGLAELPTIASNVGGIPEVISNLNTGVIVRPFDYKEISNAVVFFLKNKPEAERMAKNLKKRVESDFNLERMVSKSIDVYEK